MLKESRCLLAHFTNSLIYQTLCLILIFIEKHDLFKICKIYTYYKSNFQDSKIQDKLLSSTRMSPFSELESKIVGWLGVGTEASQPMDVTGEKKNPHTLQYHPRKLTNSENMIRNTAFKSMLLFCSYSPNKNIINLKIKPPLTFAPIITDGPLIRVLFLYFLF